MNRSYQIPPHHQFHHIPSSFLPRKKNSFSVAAAPCLIYPLYPHQFRNPHLLSSPPHRILLACIKSNTSKNPSPPLASARAGTITRTAIPRLHLDSAYPPLAQLLALPPALKLFPRNLRESHSPVCLPSHQLYTLQPARFARAWYLIRDTIPLYNLPIYLPYSTPIHRFTRTQSEPLIFSTPHTCTPRTPAIPERSAHQPITPAPSAVRKSPFGEGKSCQYVVLNFRLEVMAMGLGRWEPRVWAT